MRIELDAGTSSGSLFLTILTLLSPCHQMFEMDAYVGVDVLGLIFMRGEQPHAGFPEVRKEQYWTTWGGGR